MGRDQTGPSLADDILHLGAHGWCQLENAIPSLEVKEVLESVVATVESSDYRNDRNFLAHNKDFVGHVAESRILAVLHELWGQFYRVAWTSPLILQPGAKRGPLHIDWPFGTVWLPQSAGIPPPFPDSVLTLTAVWMLSPNSPDISGTVVVPGSHRSLVDPFMDARVDSDEPLPTEIRVPWKTGSVLLFDSRLWHTNPEHDCVEPRVTVKVCYAPWWLNLQPLDPESSEAKRMTGKFGRSAAPPMPRIPSEAYMEMSDEVRPLFHHWVSW